MFLRFNPRGTAEACAHPAGCRPGSSLAVTHSSEQSERHSWGTVTPLDSDVRRGKVKALCLLERDLTAQSLYLYIEKSAGTDGSMRLAILNSVNWAKTHSPIIIQKMKVSPAD